METLLEYKCPACGGTLSFDSGTQKMKCPYCDSELDVAALQEMDDVLRQEQSDDMHWQQAQGQWQEGEQEQLCSFICNSCGGEILCEQTTAATRCPYCDNPVVMTQRFSGLLRPDLVVPFQLDKQAAKAALRKHLTGKPLLPKMFKDENRIDKLQGIYVPFWLYDAHADADAHYRATRVHVWSDSRYNYTRTSYYSVRRSGNMDFKGVPVDGSQKMDNALMESIEPYDLSQAVDFQTAYLAGYLADKYDVDAQSCTQRANQRVKTSTESALLSTVLGYATCVPVSGSVRLSDSVIRYGLLPVWMLNTTYKGKTYTFAMNGQTGKFVGDLPVDRGAFIAWFAGLTAGIGALITLIAGLAGLL